MQLAGLMRKRQPISFRVLSNSSVELGYRTMLYRIVPAVCVFLVSLCGPLAAQPTWRNQIAISGGPQWVASPFQEELQTGSGVAVTYYSRASSHVFIGLRGGYHRFEAETGTATVNIVPLHVASKVNLSLRGVQPYIGFDGGMYLLGPDNDTSTTEYGVAPKFGFRFPLFYGVDVDLNTTYEILLRDPENTAYMGLNLGVAYIFG